MSEKYKKLEEESQKTKGFFEQSHCDEKIQVLSKEISRLTEHSNNQTAEIHDFKQENTFLKKELDLHKAKIQIFEQENNELKSLNVKILQEKKSVEVQRIYIKDEVEYNEKLKEMVMEIETLKGLLEERNIAFKAVEFEKIEIFKSNEKLYKELEDSKKEAVRLEAEIKEILLRLRTKEVEFEDFRCNYIGKFKENEHFLQEELSHWKFAYEQLFYEEIPRLREILAQKEQMAGFYMQNPPFIQSPMPIIHEIPRNPMPFIPEIPRNPDEKPQKPNKSEDLLKKIEYLEKKLMKKKSKITRIKQIIIKMERDIKYIKEFNDKPDFHADNQSLLLQIQEKNIIINNLKTQISQHKCHETSKNTDFHVNYSNSSNEFYKIEVIKLQSIIKEKNEEVHNLRLQLEILQKSSKFSYKEENEVRISLLEKELELWKRRYSENMTINMNIKEGFSKEFIKEKPIFYEEKHIKERYTDVYKEKIGYLQSVIEGKDHEILLWKKKYEDLLEIYHKLEMNYERDMGNSASKGTVFHDFHYERTSPSHYVVEVEQENQKIEGDWEIKKKMYGEFNGKGFDDKKYEKYDSFHEKIKGGKKKKEEKEEENQKEFEKDWEIKKKLYREYEDFNDRGGSEDEKLKGGKKKSEKKEKIVKSTTSY